MKRLKLLNQKLLNLGPWLIFFAGCTYVILLSFACLWKYFGFGYNALDLAIINQVFYNSAQGNFFASSIHPPTYLGDHFSPILFLILPFYYLYQDPKTLLILQTIILALCSWPIYLIAKQALNKNWGIFFALSWLASPFLQNINLFEVSFLPWAIFFILWIFYFYQKQQFLPFLIFTILTLLVREDVALVTFMFALAAIFDKRKIKWILTPLILSLGYFTLAMSLTKFFAPANSYKFLIYYSWLGNNIWEIAKNFFLKPQLVILYLFRLGNLELILGLLMPLLFLPLIDPTYLSLGLATYLQVALGASGGGILILQTQYASLFLPPVFIASIYSIKKILSQPNKHKLILKNKRIAFFILIIAVVYSALTFGPIIGATKTIINQGLISQNTLAKKELIAKIPKNAAVASTYEFLTPLSSRKNIYSFNYAFLGKQQFLSKDYSLPPDTQYLAIDFSDLNTYQLQYSKNIMYQDQYNKAKNDWPKLLNNFGLIDLKDNLALFRKNTPDQFELVKTGPEIPKPKNSFDLELNQALKFLGFTQINDQYQLFWQVNSPTVTNYALTFKLLDNDNKLVKQIFLPFAYGFLTNENKEKNIQTNHWFEFTNLPKGNYHLKLTVEQIESGGIEINELRGTKNTIDQAVNIGPEINLGAINF
jgi:uncharacterized membrane protein